MANNLSGTSEAHYPELFVDLRDQLTAMLLADGVDEERAQRIASRATEHIREHWGGQNIYIPQAVSHEVRVKAMKIYEEFNGSNLALLARREGVSAMTLYRWVRYAREEHVRKNQIPLFPE